jgi:quercetin 2,3-dioxygenase
MLKVRNGIDRGVTQIDWLDSRHSFSFGDYYDPANHHFRSLRVINEDWIAGGGGFPLHPHRDMEILTYVLSGALQHHDSMGNGSTIRPGQWQKMSAGTGIFHSEANASPSETVHLLQIWIVPKQKGLPPAYEELPPNPEETPGTWNLVASPDGRDGSIAVHQDVELYTATVMPETPLKYMLAPNRGAWVQIVSGEVTVSGRALKMGDAVAVEDEAEVAVQGHGKVLLFDLA